jgi:hypothetical protein
MSMAFAVRNLSVLAYANGFTLWHYKAGREDLAAITGSGFFSDAADLLSPGDIVMISAAGQAGIMSVGRTDSGAPALVPLG